MTTDVPRFCGVATPDFSVTDSVDVGKNRCSGPQVAVDAEGLGAKGLALRVTTSPA